MPSQAPLQIILVRHPDDEDVAPYEEAIVRALQGGKHAGGYLATGQDLNIQMKLFPPGPEPSAREVLDSFCHTLTLVLVDHALLAKGGDQLWNWLAECWSHTDQSDGRHAMLVAPMDERAGREFLKKRPVFQTLWSIDAVVSMES